MDLLRELSLERAKVRIVRTSWIIADGFSNASIESADLGNIGSTWGSWKTWRAWSTHNVLCADSAKARDLVGRAFQAVCNLYIHKNIYADIGRPTGVKLFDGEFPAEFECVEEIIAMHLIAEQNDLVLLLGYDLSDASQEDAYEKHKRKNYLAAFASSARMYPDTQWVLVDHKLDLAENISSLENITCDTYDNVLQLLG